MILTQGMAHPRTLLRQAVIALLVNANTAAAARVFDSRVDPYRTSKLPAISVMTLSEPIDPDSASTKPRELTRTCNLEVVGWVSGVDEASVALAMDNLALQIENAMDADQWLADTAADSILEDTTMEVGALNGHSDPLVGVIALTYLVTYRTDQGALATDEFLRADETIKIAGGVTDTVPAEDLFNVRTP